MTRSVAPAILAKLEPYLEQCADEWERGGRVNHTLPSTRGGKVNVRGIVAALQFSPHYSQHFFNQAEIRAVVNAVAQEQGLKPIGSFSEQDEADGVVAARMKRDAKRGSDLGKLAAEQAATIEWQRREIAGLREQLRIVEETGQIIRFDPVL